MLKKKKKKKPYKNLDKQPLVKGHLLKRLDFLVSFFFLKVGRLEGWNCCFIIFVNIVSYLILLMFQSKV